MRHQCQGEERERKKKRKEKLTGRIPDCTGSINEWELTGRLVRDDAAFSRRPAGSAQRFVASPSQIEWGGGGGA